MDCTNNNRVKPAQHPRPLPSVFWIFSKTKKNKQGKHAGAMDSSLPQQVGHVIKDVMSDNTCYPNHRTITQVRMLMMPNCHNAAFDQPTILYPQ